MARVGAALVGRSLRRLIRARMGRNAHPPSYHCTGGRLRAPYGRLLPRSVGCFVKNGRGSNLSGRNAVEILSWDRPETWLCERRLYDALALCQIPIVL
jgi:hypothetical protein